MIKITIPVLLAVLSSNVLAQQTCSADAADTNSFALAVMMQTGKTQEAVNFFNANKGCIKRTVDGEALSGYFGTKGVAENMMKVGFNPMVAEPGGVQGVFSYISNPWISKKEMELSLKELTASPIMAKAEKVAAGYTKSLSGEMKSFFSSKDYEKEVAQVLPTIFLNMDGSFLTARYALDEKTNDPKFMKANHYSMADIAAESLNLEALNVLLSRLDKEKGKQVVNQPAPYSPSPLIRVAAAGMCMPADVSKPLKVKMMGKLIDAGANPLRVHNASRVSDSNMIFTDLEVAYLLAPKEVLATPQLTAFVNRPEMKEKFATIDMVRDSNVIIGIPNRSIRSEEVLSNCDKSIKKTGK